MKTTKKKFWEVLGELKGKFEVLESGQIREKKAGRCPVCAVAYRLANKEYKRYILTGNNTFSASLIGMEIDFSVDIALSSDYPECDYLSDKNRKLRRRILRVLNLSELGD